MNRNTTNNKNKNLNAARSASAPNEGCHQNKKGLIYWSNPRKSGATFVATLVSLLIFRNVNVISVLLKIGYMILFTSFAVELSTKVLFDRGIVSRFGMQESPDVVSVVKPHIDRALGHLPALEDRIRKLVFAHRTRNNVTIGISLYFLHGLFAIFSMNTVLIMTTIFLYTMPLMYDRKQTRIDHAIDRVKDLVIHRFHKNYSKVVEKTEPYIDKIIPAQTDEDSYSTSVSDKDNSSTSQRNKDNSTNSERIKDNAPISQSGKDSHSISQYSQGNYPIAQNEDVDVLRSGKHELPTEKDFNNRHENFSKPEVKTYDPREVDIEEELEAHKRELEQNLKEGDYNLVGSKQIPDPITVPAPTQQKTSPTKNESFPISKNNETLNKTTHGLKHKLQHA
ncbi:rtn2p [Saccharomyces arboricola H-6]|uniref:Reticulon-like protein n=1 Tax=Saccharomyces arboricola (strain H-6 / AS 2.3317 / CBS 10644) TaxID=1160507 RepID=J8QA26_SACAR|nr:rtn2p [Saccharomyces arboricola H-6]